jgi:hypothetical protein
MVILRVGNTPRASFNHESSALSNVTFLIRRWQGSPCCGGDFRFAQISGGPLPRIRHRVLPLPR